MQQMQSQGYVTKGGIKVYRASVGIDGPLATQALQEELNSTQGVLLSSSYEYPGRYSRWDIGFSSPPLRITAKGRKISCEALNQRGQKILRILVSIFFNKDDFAVLESSPSSVLLRVRDPEPVIFEEDRSKQRTVFTFLRAILDLFASSEDAFIGLYGAFGYELAFQFEAVKKRLRGEESDRDLVLYLPDSILVVDHQRQRAQQHYYDFEFDIDGSIVSTRGLARSIKGKGFQAKQGDSKAVSDHVSGAYADVVRKALNAFHRGDLFEVVPGHTISTQAQDKPSAIFQRLQKQNPAPYGALMNLGEAEYLVAASPEMFVRVEGATVETCPISGTIARGSNALEDAAQIKALLNSSKDEAELSMCTDVDRNDKSRVCIPGTVEVTGRRQIEMYSRLIHTVDHVKGELKPDYDALDAFLSHAWAVTVTGAPKHAAMQFIEDNELSSRHWYGGAMGYLNFNGNLNSGLTIRTIRIKDGQAQVRVGATLLADSDPDAEERETQLKASALMRALQVPKPEATKGQKEPLASPSSIDRLQVLMLDHQDSFVHTLSAYFQRAGAQVRTIRPVGVEQYLATNSPDLIVLSPGPGRPDDFALAHSIEIAIRNNIAVFGVCLGLQGIVEFFGGSLKQLERPVHGKQSTLIQLDGMLFTGLAAPLEVGRYHSLVADSVPDCLRVCALSDDGELMALEHKHLAISAVQFHPESILSAHNDSGQCLLNNVLQAVAEQRQERLMQSRAGRQR